MAKQKDMFSQLAYIAVTESGANTLTFASMTVFSNILTPKGLLIHRVSYNLPTGTWDLITTADGDSLYFGLAGDDSMTAVAMDDPKIYDYNLVTRDDAGTAAAANILNSPKVVDFTMLPGSGKLVPADRLYIWCAGESLTGAATVQARIDFTVADLDASEYLELAQSLRILT